MANLVVETTYGQVKGENLGEVCVWRGIPYAKPPVGELRFKPPAKLDKWEGIRDATQFGPVSPQAPSEVISFLGNDASNMSEDCLYLNIWSPAADNKRRAVMVWIHGGAFVAGSGSTSWYDGANFSKNGDVVIVTLNYRLGMLGFLHLGELNEEFSTSGNNGILDQIAALQWVKENIERFGGDPERVTVFGESAGAMSIGTLLGAPGAKGLFQQAILQSGASHHAISSKQATEVSKTLLSLLKIDPADKEQLQTVPVNDLLEATKKIPAMSLLPVVDGKVLPEHPLAAITKGSAKDVKILIGTNKDEYNIFSAFDPLWKNADENMKEMIFAKTFGERWAQMKDIFAKDIPLTVDLYNQLMTIQIFVNPAITLAELQLKNDTPVWMYRFDWESPVMNGVLKSSHALEIPFVWNNLHKENTDKILGTDPQRQIIADSMHEAWLNFAKYGKPEGKSLPEWPAYDLEKRAVMVFDVESSVLLDPHKWERENWEKVTVNMA